MFKAVPNALSMTRVIERDAVCSSGANFLTVSLLFDIALGCTHKK